MKALQFLKPGEHVMIVFTHGDLFEVNPDHTGSTGNWITDAHRHVDRVIIYQRDHGSHTASLYTATFVGSDLTDDDPPRRNIRFEHIQYVGTTDENWHDFAETGAFPVRYLP